MTLFLSDDRKNKPVDREVPPEGVLASRCRTTLSLPDIEVFVAVLAVSVSVAVGDGRSAERGHLQYVVAEVERAPAGIGGR